jgi:hypothetical protein
MNTASALQATSTAPDRSTVITNSVLVARRIKELHRRRQALGSRQEHLRAQLPDWAIEPLRLVGMTGDEIRGMVDEMSSAETESGLEAIEHEIDDLDEQIEQLEGLLVTTPSASLDEMASVLRLAMVRFHENTVTDPENVFYDHGEARILSLVERVHDDLHNYLQRSALDAG